MSTPITNSKTFDIQITGDAYTDRIPYPDGSGDLVASDDMRALELAANAMFEVMSNNRPECYGFHHDKGDRHAVGDPCPLVERYNKALFAYAALQPKEPHE